MTNTKPSKTRSQSHSLDLLALYDNVSEFDACCAFFCDAVAALSNGKDEWLEGTSAEGLRCYAQRLKEESAAIKGEVEVAWKAASAMERH